MSRRGAWIAVAAAGAVVVGAAVTTVVRVNAAPPPPSLQLSVPSSFIPVPGPPPAVHQPPQGSFDLQGNGRDLALLDADTPHPIASVAKAMSAFVVLRDRPLADRFDEGPLLTMGPAEVQDYRDAVANGGSRLPVALGEKLTEKQMLLGLLLPSANNFASSLGRWVSGSVDQFVAELNTTAQQLGMSHTHFVDPSGFSPDTVSSASDLVILGNKVLGVPALAALVATQHASLPDGTSLDNLDTLLGSEPGWLGIKTGNTDEAGGCLLFAARRQVGSGTVTMVGAVLGQTDLHGALDAAKTAVDSGYLGYAAIPVTDVPVVSGTVTTRWGDTSGVHLPLGNQPQDGIPVRMGTVLHLSVSRAGLAARMASGRVLAWVDASDGLQARVRWAVALDQDVMPPSFWWMLFEN